MSICLSCGNQRDNCDLCGGDLEDANVYCATQERETELILLRAVAEAGRGTCVCCEDTNECEGCPLDGTKLALAALDAWREATKC